MFALVGATLLLTQSVSFKVFRQVNLSKPLLHCNFVSRDGTLLGCSGYMWPTDGQYKPIIVLKGKQIRIRNVADLICEVQGFAEGGGYVVEDCPGGEGSCRANWRDGKLLPTHGKVARPGGPPDESWRYERVSYGVPPLQGDISNLFPIAKNEEDTLGISSLEWIEFGELTLGNAEFDQGMVSSYRAIVRDQSGKVWRLEDYIPALSSFLCIKIDRVNKAGWLVVEAVSRKGAGKDFVTAPGGDVVFWLRSTPLHPKRHTPDAQVP